MNNQQKTKSSERKRKSRHLLKERGGRSLDLQLDPESALYLKKLSIIYRVSYAKLIRNMIHNAAIQIRYPLDIWIKRIRLPAFLNESDILEMPIGTTLYLGNFDLVAHNIEENDNTNKLILLLYKKDLKWLIYVNWVYKGGKKLDRFPKRMGEFGIYYSFMIEDGYVIFDSIHKQVEKKITSFCRYTAYVAQQISQSVKYKGYQWVVSSNTPFILMPDD